MLKRSLRRHVKLARPLEARPTFRRRIFGLSFPVPSNDPLAGTAAGDGIPFLFIASVVVGLPLTLWAYKCLMLVAFQRKIIYLPSVPPGTRNESLAHDERTRERDSSLSDIDWKEVNIESRAPTRLLRRKVALKGVELGWKTTQPAPNLGSAGETRPPRVVVIYLQGNAGTPLLRIPLFRRLLQPEVIRSTSARRPSIPPRSESPSQALEDLTVVAVAPRSFWLSTRSTPTEASVLADYRAALDYAYGQYGPSAKYVLYGHSLGGAAAILLLEQLSIPPFFAQPQHSPPAPTISGVIFENPLPSIPFMVRALYPQKWLPYHYLGFASFDRWDAIGRLRALARGASTTTSMTTTVPSLWIRSGRDEIIPTEAQDGVREMFENWKAIEDGARRGAESGEVRARWVKIDGALHDTAYLEGKWRDELRQFLREIAKR
ncbi:hypothetical protein JCM11491_003404 [Sporobolomyces phaffii]